MVDSNLPKQLRIKTGSLKRIHKEFISYQKEEIQQRKKIDKMKADGIDEWTVRKQVEVLQETLDVLPNTEGRLNDALNDLASWLEEYRDDPSVKETEQLQEAQEQLVLIREFLENIKLKEAVKDEKDDKVKPDPQVNGEDQVKPDAQVKPDEKPEQKPDEKPENSAEDKPKPDAGGSPDKKDQ